MAYKKKTFHRVGLYLFHKTKGTYRWFEIDPVAWENSVAVAWLAKPDAPTGIATSGGRYTHMTKEQAVYTALQMWFRSPSATSESIAGIRVSSVSTETDEV